MALLESCCGCSLAVSSAVLGVYLLVAYIIAFTIELWWILEYPATPPIPAYLLCLGYFFLFTFSSLLLHGLSVKRTTFLLVWLFMMGILLGPEAGLVLYLSIHYWRITSIYGLIEVTCWTCRLLVNAIGLLCVQSLYSIWREEKSVLLRLEALKTQNPLPKPHRNGKGLSVPSVFQGYKNQTSEKKYTGPKAFGQKADTNAYNRWEDALEREVYDNAYINPCSGNGFSEFNASSFDPSVIDARLQTMPYLTIRKKKPEEFNRIMAETESDLINEETIPKTRSLIDLSIADFNNVETLEIPQKPKSYFVKSVSGEKNDGRDSRKMGNNPEGLDKEIIKNKNLKILKMLSPFYSKKSEEEVNIYRINPPSHELGDGASVSNLDRQLNKVYGNRGMYKYDEKTKKVIYYPPEFFNNSTMPKFRSRINSNGSSQSRSSIDTDSEDIKHIRDVAL